jgi:hypothetical protein
MHGSRGLRGEQRTIARLGALAAAVALCLLVVAAPAGGAPLIGKDGKVYACYRTKGKAKGSVRLVAKKAKCRKGEKKVAWNAVGQSGGAGSPGETGSGGSGGEGGPTGAAGLEGRVANLASRVETLEDKLKGISNLALTEVISKLQGISGKQLQEAIGAVANVNALTTKVNELCTQATKLTSQSNALSSALGGLSLGGLIPIGLELLVPKLPAALPGFSCP